MNYELIIVLNCLDTFIHYYQTSDNKQFLYSVTRRLV